MSLFFPCLFFLIFFIHVLICVFFWPALIAPFSSFGSQFGKHYAHEDRQLTGPQALLDELLANFDMMDTDFGLGAVKGDELDTIIKSLSFWFCLVWFWLCVGV